MKILFIANRIPFPPFRGDKLKIYNLAKRIGENHDVHLVTFCETKEELNYQKELSEIFSKINLVYRPKWLSNLTTLSAFLSGLPFQVAYFKSAKMKQQLAQMLAVEDYDAIHVQHIRMSPYANAIDKPKILDLPDAFSLYWKRRSEKQNSLFKRLFDGTEAKRLIRYEPILNDFDLGLVCSEEDQSYLKTTHSMDHISLLKNGVDIDYFSQEEGHNYALKNCLLFTGNMDYAPNVDGVLFFMKEIWPELKSDYPQLKFVIAGQRPIAQIENLASEKVEVTGFVQDIRTAYSRASVVIAPLRFGAGTQNKVLEAMSMGIPVVCSDIGFEGLGIQSGDGVIKAERKEEFIVAIKKLLDSQELRKEMGEKGREVAVKNYGWDAIAIKLEEYFYQITK